MKLPVGTAPCSYCGQLLSVGDPTAASDWSSIDGLLASIRHRDPPEGCLRAMAARIAALEKQSTGAVGEGDGTSPGEEQ